MVWWGCGCFGWVGLGLWVVVGLFEVGLGGWCGGSGLGFCDWVILGWALWWGWGLGWVVCWSGWSSTSV